MAGRRAAGAPPPARRSSPDPPPVRYVRPTATWPPSAQAAPIRRAGPRRASRATPAQSPSQVRGEPCRGRPSPAQFLLQLAQLERDGLRELAVEFPRPVRALQRHERVERPEHLRMRLRSNRARRPASVPATGSSKGRTSSPPGRTTHRHSATSHRRTRGAWAPRRIGAGRHAEHVHLGRAQVLDPGLAHPSPPGRQRHGHAPQFGAPLERRVAVLDRHERRLARRQLVLHAERRDLGRGLAVRRARAAAAIRGSRGTRPAPRASRMRARAASVAMVSPSTARRRDRSGSRRSTAPARQRPAQRRGARAERCRPARRPARARRRTPAARGRTPASAPSWPHVHLHVGQRRREHALELAHHLRLDALARRDELGRAAAGPRDARARGAGSRPRRCRT